MAEKAELVMRLNDRLVPYSQAMDEMSASEPELAGGLYDAERTFHGQMFKLRRHLQWLYQGLELARLEPGMSIEEMEESTLEVLEANRPLLEPGDDFILSQVVSIEPVSNGESQRPANVAIYCQFIDFSKFAQSYVKGVRVITPTTYSPPPRPEGDGADSQPQETVSLMMDSRGNITECRHANFLFVTDGRIKLPDREKVLPGISMETVVELAEQLSIPVDEGGYSPADIYIADEAFISGTRFCLEPVATLNGLSLGDEVPGPVTRRLQAAWSEMVGIDFVKQASDYMSNHGPAADPQQ